MRRGAEELYMTLEVSVCKAMSAERRSGKGTSGGEDAASMASTSTMASMQDLTAADELEYVDPFERCLEALYEKR
jgi:hypothetical protein